MESRETKGGNSFDLEDKSSCVFVGVPFWLNVFRSAESLFTSLNEAVITPGSVAVNALTAG